jgi:hypothetical protein
MTALTVPAHDRQSLRLFALDLPRAEALRLARPSPTDTFQVDAAAQTDRAAILSGLLGVTQIDPDHVEVFDIADLAGLGLAGYLAEGGNIPSAQIDPDRARLQALTGPVLVLFPRALTDLPATLALDPRLTLIGTYAEDRAPIHFDPLPTAMAQGTLTAGPPAPPARALPRIALILGVALLLTGLVAVLLALR